jgi:hypothetical protein
MQHIHQWRLFSRCAEVVIHVGLEEPVFRRSLNLQPGCCQAVRSQLNIVFSHHKINIMAWLRSAVNPEGVTAAEGKRYSVGLESRCRLLERGTQRRLVFGRRRGR